MHLMDIDGLSVFEVSEELHTTIGSVRVNKAKADRAVDIFLEKRYGNL
jgi:hypothetical protein